MVRLDPATWAVTARVSTPSAPDGLVAGPDGRLRLVAQQGPTLVVINPANAAVVSQRVLGTALQLYDQANLSIGHRRRDLGLLVLGGRGAPARARLSRIRHRRRHPRIPR